ncbi:MAG: glycosyltransferase [Oscillospiraceae bacterium]|nr:glycosyltransferase [Oscillospiraceae bacterium]
MNVCLLNDSFPPLIDGVANTVINYAENLTAFGDRVTVAVPQYPDVEDDYSYQVIRYPSFDTTKFVGYRAGYPFAGAAVDVVRDFVPDIYHSHCPAASTFMGRTFREVVPAPVVFTYHTKFDIDIARALRSHLLQDMTCNAMIRNIEACDEVWVVSDGAGKNLRSLGFHGDYRVMNNGVDFPKKLPDSEAVSELRKQYGLEDGIPVFLFVGRIMWYKGLRTVLDAMTALKDAGLDFRFMCVGGGQDRDDVIRYAERQRITDKCIFVDAVHDREVLRTYYGAADLFVFLSDFDTNGIVVREAAACGLGSMLLRGSAAAEGTENLGNAILVEDNPASAAAMLARLCYEPSVMKGVGERAMNELYFSWTDSVRVARDRYEQISDDYKSGKLALKHQPVDSFFEFAAELNSVFERGKDLFSRN